MSEVTDPARQMRHVLSHLMLLALSPHVRTCTGVTAETSEVKRDHCQGRGGAAIERGNSRVQMEKCGACNWEGINAEGRRGKNSKDV